MSIVTNALFFGVAYSPSNALEPQCGFTRRDAMLDLARLSTITTKIRNYGMHCDQSEFILDAIEYMNLNMTLAMGVWIGSNDTVNEEQMNTMKRIVAKYPNPLELINSIHIGNEVLFREDKTRDELIEYIQDAKTFLQSKGIDDIPVGTSEIWFFGRSASFAKFVYCWCQHSSFFRWSSSGICNHLVFRIS